MLSELNFITGKADEKTKYFNVFPCFDRVRQHYQRQYVNCSDSGQC